MTEHFLSIPIFFMTSRNVTVNRRCLNNRLSMPAPNVVTVLNDYWGNC